MIQPNCYCMWSVRICSICLQYRETFPHELLFPVAMDFVVPMVEMSESLLFDSSALSGYGAGPDVDGIDVISADVSGIGRLFGVLTRRLTDTSIGYTMSAPRNSNPVSSLRSSSRCLMPDVCECLTWRCSFNDIIVTLETKIWKWGLLQNDKK